jgi:hypothetical protein
VGSGPIGKYWQTRCVGFEVRSSGGRLLGTVSRIGLYPESGRAVSLYVDRGGRRVRPLMLEPEQVVSVDPWSESLVVELPRRERQTAAARARTASLAAATVAGVRAGSRRAVGSGRRAVPPTRRMISGFAVWTANAFVFACFFGALAAFNVARGILLLGFAAMDALEGARRRMAPPLARAAGHAAAGTSTAFARHRPTSRHVRDVRRAVVSRSHALRGR